MPNTILSIQFDYKTRGAQENDQASASTIYKELGYNVIECFIDIGSNKIRLCPEIEVIKSSYLNIFRIFLRYSLFLLLNFDRSQREFYTFKNFYNITICLQSLNNPIVIAENSDLTFLTFASPKFRCTRSVNFAPVHNFKENNLFKGIILFLPKLVSMILERMLNNILAVDRKDLSYYKLIPSRKKIEFLPLRNLILNQNIQVKPLSFSKVEKSFTILASTYSVTHNLKNLSFFYSAFINFKIDNLVFNIYGSKIPNFDFGAGNFKINGFVEEVDQIFEENDVFVAMFGGTGMMSKLYEPFSKGKLVIANPKLFKNSNFLPNIHYLPAQTPYQFISQIAYSICRPAEVEKYRIAGFKLFTEIFNEKEQFKRLSIFLNNIR